MSDPQHTIEYALGRIEAKLDHLLALDGRVTALEMWKSRTTGYVLGAGAVITTVSGIIAFIVSALK
jgi:hypothetical protein